MTIEAAWMMRPGTQAAAKQALRAIAALILLCVVSNLAVAVEQDSAPIHATAYSASGTSKQTRIHIEFNRNPEPRWFLLRNPYRLVIDLPATRFDFDPKTLKATGLVSGVRFGATGQGRSRLILTALKPFKVERIGVDPAEGLPATLSVVVSGVTQKAFDTALGEQAERTGSAAATPDMASSATGGDLFTVVVDAGHGGIDSGAKSAQGTHEKAITLTFARELKAKLESTNRYKVLMTRESDIFIPLAKRVAFARDHAADLFISIHADSIRVKGLRGATVYTVSNEASDAAAAALADRENLSDQIGGIEIKEENQEVADILVDLIRRETHGFSISFARTLVGELKQAMRMITNPHRHAGFRVLRAPDVPSVLVELGYLSNIEDEEQLRSAEWRARTADSIVDAIDAFSANAPKAGG